MKLSAWLGIIAISGGLYGLAACSSDEGGGTGGGGGATGGSAGKGGTAGKSGGAGSSGTAGGGAAGATGGGAGMSGMAGAAGECNTGAADCTACLGACCATEQDDCANNNDCAAISTCYENNCLAPDAGDVATCIATCEAANPGGKTLFDAFVVCGAAHCLALCSA